MRRNALFAGIVFVVLMTGTLALAEGTTQHARFQYGNRTATFQSAERTITATDDVRSGELAQMYKTISGKEWTTEKEAKGGVLELAFLDALAEQGWEVAQVNYRDAETVYLLKKQK
jgi:hypothetical protein